MDAQALENAALAAAEAAATVDEIEQVRVEYLGRKSELKLALREVRDRETGMALNALREKLDVPGSPRPIDTVRRQSSWIPLPESMTNVGRGSNVSNWAR